MRGLGNKKPRPKELASKDLASKELASKELGVLGYSDLLGLGVLGYSDLLGVGIDEWKSRCNVPPGGGTLHLHICFQ